MRYDSIQFHNAAELRDIDDHGGRRVQRVPEAVRTELNDGAQTRMCHPAGVELRFVPDPGETVEVTLSTAVRESTVRVFWGPFQSGQAVEVGAEPTTIAVEFPEKLGRIRDEHRDGLDYAPEVCRLRLPGEHRGGHVFYHGADGERRPPTAAELPDRRYLAYGTSITEGEAASAEHLTYVSQAATRLGADPVNLGSCGSAYCDRAIADHVAERDDWDVATLAVSVNMVADFPVEVFRERADHLVNAVADANPGKPVVPITIYPSGDDVCMDPDWNGRAEEFRDALRGIVADCEHGNVHLLEGPALLDGIGGMAPDILHPGDDAMIRMGENVADELERVLD